MSNGGKGDQPRPFSVAREEFEARWDAIFNKGKSNIQVASSGENKTHMSPPADSWRGLTEDEIEELWAYHADTSGDMCESEARKFAGTIEAWLRERNS